MPRARVCLACPSSARLEFAHNTLVNASGAADCIVLAILKARTKQSAPRAQVALFLLEAVQMRGSLQRPVAFAAKLPAHAVSVNMNPSLSAGLFDVLLL